MSTPSCAAQRLADRAIRSRERQAEQAARQEEDENDDDGAEDGAVVVEEVAQKTSSSSMKAAVPITGPSTVPGPPSRHMTGTLMVMMIEKELFGSI